MTMTDTLTALTGKPLSECTNSELYLSLLKLVNEKAAQQIRPVQGRKLYYISAEFLIGKLLSNNLINLGLYDDVRSALQSAGKKLSDIEEVEPEPSLGNGGLGRLAACFLDSAASCNLPLSGYGLRYRFGLFKQKFDENGSQKETADDWTKYGDPWSYRRCPSSVTKRPTSEPCAFGNAKQRRSWTLTRSTPRITSGLWMPRIRRRTSPGFCTPTTPPGRASVCG